MRFLKNSPSASPASLAYWRSVKRSSPPNTPLSFGEIIEPLGKSACPANYRNAFERSAYDTCRRASRFPVIGVMTRALADATVAVAF